MKRAVLVVMAACACPTTPPTKAPVQGAGSAAATPTTCEGVRPRVEQLYRAEAQTKEPARIDEAVADNTQMVMNDCAQHPSEAVPCLAKAVTIAELETHCLFQVDDEGTEAK
jgi:hypothetical protein